MKDQEKLYCHALNCVTGIGAQKFRKLAAFFGNLEAAWQANSADLEKSGMGEKLSHDIIAFRKNNSPEKLFSELEKESIEIVSFADRFFPSLLKETPSPPALIYVKGNKRILDCKSIAVVGSRKFTTYGERVTQNLCRDLARAGLMITSGLALGIDGIAHGATLSAGGTTIAVLGTGIDDATIYPREHFTLSKKILAGGGALITEYPPKTPSLKQNFPARNRIMAGMTLGTLVVEAARNSGSLITAGFALEYCREVFSIPGPLFSPQSEGTNFLIKNGAKLVESASDILEELRVVRSGNEYEPLSAFKPETNEEKSLWNVLGQEPLHVDTLAKLTKLNPALASSTLAMMEIEGAVKNIGGQNYIKL